MMLSETKLFHFGQIIRYFYLFLHILANYETFGRENEITVMFPPGGIDSSLDVFEMRFSSNAKNGVLLAAKGESGQHGYLLEIDNDKLRLQTTIDGASKIIETGRYLSDGQWHQIKIRRGGKKVQLQLDNSEKIERDIESKTDVMKLQSLIIGVAKSKPQFDGSIQKFSFNNNDIIKQCREDRLLPGYTCRMRNRPKDLTGYQAPNPSNPITFKTRSAFARIDDTFATTTSIWRRKQLTISLDLRTTEEDGILFWSGPSKLMLTNEKLIEDDGYSRASNDAASTWAVLETVNGRLNWIWKPLGAVRPEVLTSNKVISDNMWHSVEIKLGENERNMKSWFISIDKGRRNDENVRPKPIGNGWETFLKDNAVLVGGMPEYLWNTVPIAPIVSTQGYLGCLGSIFINSNQVKVKPKKFEIETGCVGPDQTCNGVYCKNGGQCKQEWNKLTCDCSRTSFIGDTCTKRKYYPMDYSSTVCTSAANSFEN